MRIVATGAHLTYPHANGFHDGRLLLARHEAGRGATALVSVDLGGKDERLVAAIAPRRDGVARPAYPDVAEGTGRAAWIWDDVLYIADEPGAAEIVYTAAHLQNVCAITRDGASVVVVRETGDRWIFLRIDLATGYATELFTRPWRANHPHHSPFDESWLAYAHEGPAREIPDRVWAWHDGRHVQVLDQAAISAVPGAFVAVGHERWLHHDLGAAVVAYGDSEAGPRGLYFTHPDGRPPRLVAAGERLWHCDVSRDGRWAVADTTGPSDLPGRGWQDAGGVCDVLLVEVATGHQVRLARTTATSHPDHPHPIFTPAGDEILFNHQGSVAAVAL
ncbi:oligogalacturonate lyase family protein [Nonomuraea sp. NBC_01738]|uniref:oligogalacturonate lyase family protein n=1 Tax=Nonomuraea sp. NBC_01738 TaxID=2976003 RepID=UPI002E0D8D44|nr:oligogalacturonate lyase family protein [Nonomuraea sp. NBC_01738]